MSDPTRFDLERMALGEIPTPEEHVDEVEELRGSNEQLLEDYPAGAHVPEIEQRVRASTTRSSTVRWVGAGALAAAAAIAIAIGLPVDRPEPRTLVPGTDGEVRLKGPEVRLQVWKKTGGGEQLLADGEAIAPGVLVQPKYGVARPAYGVLFSVDGHGDTTLFHPTTPGGETRVEPGGMQAAPFAYELDDAPNFERFHFVVCDTEVDVKGTIERVTAGAPPGDSCTMETVELKKR